MTEQESNTRRVDALAQLKTAQIMLREGNEELRLATGKIQRAQELIDQSADMLRQTAREMLAFRRLLPPLAPS